MQDIVDFKLKCILYLVCFILSVAVPVFIMFVSFINIAMTDNLFDIAGMLSQITGVAGIEVWTAIGVLLIGMVMCAWTL